MLNFSLFKYCEQSKNREPILCKKKRQKKPEYDNKVSAYACFIKNQKELENLNTLAWRPVLRYIAL